MKLDYNINGRHVKMHKISYCINSAPYGPRAVGGRTLPINKFTNNIRAGPIGT